MFRPGATRLQISPNEFRLPPRNQSENNPPQDPTDVTSRLARLEAAYQNTLADLRDAEARIRYLEASYSQARADAHLLTRRVDRLSAALGEKDVVIDNLGRKVEQVMNGFQGERERQTQYNRENNKNVDLLMNKLEEAQRGVMGLAEGMFNKEERISNLEELVRESEMREVMLPPREGPPGTD